MNSVLNCILVAFSLVFVAKPCLSESKSVDVEDILNSIDEFEKNILVQDQIVSERNKTYSYEQVRRAIDSAGREAERVFEIADQNIYQAMKEAEKKQRKKGPLDIGLDLIEFSSHMFKVIEGISHIEAYLIQQDEHGGMVWVLGSEDDDGFIVFEEQESGSEGKEASGVPKEANALQVGSTTSPIQQGEVATLASDDELRFTKPEAFKRARENLDWFEEPFGAFPRLSDQGLANEAEKRMKLLLDDLAFLEGLGPEYSKYYQEHDGIDFKDWKTGIVHNIGKVIVTQKPDWTLPFKIVFGAAQTGDSSPGNSQSVRRLHREAAPLIQDYFFWKTKRPLLNPADFPRVDPQTLIDDLKCREYGCYRN